MQKINQQQIFCQQDKNVYISIKCTYMYMYMSMEKCAQHTVYVVHICSVCEEFTLCST